MASASQRVVAHLPYLRRYARALLGSQAAGDAGVKRCLDRLVAEPGLLDEGDDDRLTIFRAFHAAIDEADGSIAGASAAASAQQAAADDRLGDLPSAARRIVLLTAMEGFTLDEAAHALFVPADQAARLLEQGRAEIDRQMAADVLIIEDEPIIALDLQGLAEELGHRVIGVASTRTEAVKLAGASRPGLVLADIQLADGSSGVDAVNDILGGLTAPVIFITAYPERLLTGERPEPTFLITKPFSPDSVKVTINQALFFKKNAQAAA
ncbi:MAG: response regulator [Pseudomonadota bacterium]